MMQEQKKGKTAVVAGATGLIGGFLVQALAADPAYGRVILLTRRPMPSPAPKVTPVTVDFNDPDSLRAAFDTADVLFCAVGTTQKKVKGDKAQYRKVDYDIPVNLARLGKEKGVPHYILVSAVGADAASGNFYLKLKGEVEAAVDALQLPSVYAMQPSLLLGPRQEYRLGERIAQSLSGVMDLLMRGSLGKYRPVQAESVARAMVAADTEGKPGMHIWQYDEMMQRTEPRSR